MIPDAVKLSSSNSSKFCVRIDCDHVEDSNRSYDQHMVVGMCFFCEGVVLNLCSLKRRRSTTADFVSTEFTVPPQCARPLSFLLEQFWVLLKIYRNKKRWEVRARLTKIVDSGRRT